MKTPLAVALAVAVTGLASTASAEAPTLDERVAALEEQVIALQSNVSILDVETAAARLLGKCIRAAEPVRFRNGFVVPDPHAVGRKRRDDGSWSTGTTGVYWVAIVHPQCVTEPEKASRAKSIR